MSRIAYFPPPPTIESLGGASDQDLADHSADTTSVHGVTDTAVLATDAEVASAVSVHSADTTSVHGIPDTSALPLKTAANVWTATQEIEGVRPELLLDSTTPGQATGHLQNLGTSDALMFSSNLSYDGTNYVLDDIAEPGAGIVPLANGLFVLIAAPAGANPRPITAPVTLKFGGIHAANPPDPAGSGEANIFIIDTGLAQSLRIRYNDGGTMREGNVALA